MTRTGSVKLQHRHFPLGNDGGRHRRISIGESGQRGSLERGWPQPFSALTVTAIATTGGRVEKEKRRPYLNGGCGPGQHKLTLFGSRSVGPSSSSGSSALRRRFLQWLKNEQATMGTSPSFQTLSTPLWDTVFSDVAGLVMRDRSLSSFSDRGGRGRNDAGNVDEQGC